jgi:DNA-directed RNA polymerase subunit RPC12/RpoP
MILSMNGGPDAGAPHSARAATESWAGQNLYCPNCTSSKLDLQDNGELSCLRCRLRFLVKGQKNRLGKSVADGAYDATARALRSAAGPGYFFVHYDDTSWTVRNVLLVPHFALPPSAVVKRPGSTGCRFALDRIPLDARITIITTIKSSKSGDTECIMISRPEEVRERFHRLKPLADIPAKQRALTLDLLNLVRNLAASKPKNKNPKSASGTFANEDIYACESELEKWHPEVSKIHDKIRRQLLVLKDCGFLTQHQTGVWKMK